MCQIRRLIAMSAITTVLLSCSRPQANAYTLKPIGAECPLPGNLDNQELLDQIATVEIGDTSAEVTEKVETPDNPLTRYNAPSQNYSVMSWVRDEGDGNTMEIRVEFENDQVIERVLGIGSGTGDICSWSIES